MIRLHSTCWLALPLALGGLTLPGSARAADADTDATPDDGALGNHQKHVRLDVGARTQFIKSAGFDPFSKNDVLPQVTLAASGAFWAQDRLSLAGVIGFDYGATSEKARSDRAELSVARFVLAPELRYHLLRLVVLTGKVGPTLTREQADLDGGLASTLSKTSWKFGFDATAGAAVEVWGTRAAPSTGRGCGLPPRAGMAGPRR